MGLINYLIHIYCIGLLLYQRHHTWIFQGSIFMETIMQMLRHLIMKNVHLILTLQLTKITTGTILAQTSSHFKTLLSLESQIEME